MIVEVWTLHPDPALFASVHPGERTRARRFRRLADRERSLTGAALLRAYAARVGSVAADRVEVRRRCPHCGAVDHGPPRIDGAQVSLSHSGDWVLLATAPVRVGVDVESGPVGAELAGELLAPDEPADDLARSWVRKEAVAKLVGTGLMQPLSQIRITEGGAGWTAQLAGFAYAGRELPLPLPAAVAVDAPEFELRLHRPEETRALLF